jgi:hypothetical protein
MALRAQCCSPILGSLIAYLAGCASFQLRAQHLREKLDHFAARFAGKLAPPHAPLVRLFCHAKPNLNYQQI